MARDLIDDEATLDRIVEGVRSGLPMVTAARRAGVEPIALYELLHAGRYAPPAVASRDFVDHYRAARNSLREARLRDFAHRVDVARAEWEAEHFQNVAQEALGHKNGQPQWKASAWILNNHPDTRRTYRQEKNALEDRRDPLPIYQQVAQLSDDELKALASGEANSGELE